MIGFKRISRYGQVVAFLFAVTVLGGALSSLHAQDALPVDSVDKGAASPFFPWGAWAEKIKTAELVAPVGSEAFGEEVAPFSGRTAFSMVDIDVPGNGDLPVQLRRRFSVDAMQVGSTMEPLGGLGSWSLDVPYLAGVFDEAYPWTVNTANLTAGRCSTAFYPKLQPELGAAWSGYRVHLPGKGDRSLLVRDAAIPVPTGVAGAYVYTTAELDAFRCLDPPTRGAGEGFVMQSADGTVWTFNVEARRGAGIVEVGGANYPRVEIYLLASKVEDRHGNRVDYVYEFPAGARAYRPRLKEIRGTSALGEVRSIMLGWSGTDPDSRRLQSATAHGRTWTYMYDGDNLSQVELPDRSVWLYEYDGSLTVGYGPNDSDNRCVPPLQEGGNFALTVTHPAGARAAFEFSYARFVRSINGLGTNCFADISPPPMYEAFALDRKIVTGAAVSAMVWDYTGGSSRYAPEQLAHLSEAELRARAPVKVTTRLIRPDGSILEQDFGNVYNVNEGRLLATRIMQDGQSQPLRKEVLTYMTDAEAATARFPSVWGLFIGSEDQLSARIRPVRVRTTTQDGVTFTRKSEVLDYDVLARVEKEELSSKLDNSTLNSKTRQTTYDDNRSKWVMGQIATVTETHDGRTRTLVTNGYDAATANLVSVSEFGLLPRTQEWYTDGMLKSQTDAASKTTKFEDYKRGIPRKVLFADRTTQMTATVDDWGQIRTATDPLGNTTTYDYDAGGRLSSIIYPVQSGRSWNATQIVHERLKGPKDNVACPGGQPSCIHWRHTRTTGTAVRTTWSDALWRPLLAKEEDTARAGTAAWTQRSFDHEGRETFASYPASAASASKGVHTERDALGRVRRVAQDWELGQFETLTDYEEPLVRKSRDPRGNVTRTEFQAFGEPSYESPTQIRQAVGTSKETVTAIVRDGLGKPTSVTRSGSYATPPNSATRSYVYDANERLCAVTEPETGTTVFDYDPSGNLAWRAQGTASSTCNRSAVNGKIGYDYDALNRLRTTTFSDGTDAITQDWYADGALYWISTNGAKWTYTYGSRRQLESETLAVDGLAFRLDWTHDANGHVNGLVYPDQTALDLAPDALGRPTKVGSFAANVAWYPNGAVKSFTYGNGIAHSLSQNARKLPARSTDGTVSDLAYDYDGNGNVTGITDYAQGGLDTRTLTYDGLDRLETATALARWGVAAYEYDPLDNLRKSTVGGAITNHVINPTTNRLDALTGAQSISYGYNNPRGNVTSRAGRTFTFDGADRITATSVSGADAEAYRYDGHGRRVRIDRANGAKTYQIYSRGGQLLHERAPDGKVTNHVYLSGSLIARSTPGGGGGGGAPPTPTATPNPSFDGLYTVKWCEVEGATQYQLLQRIDGGTEGALYTGPKCTWVPPTAKPSGQYAYRVAICSPTCGTPGASVTVTVLRPLAAPTASPNPSTTGTYTVSWGTLAGATHYRLEEQSGGGGWTEVQNLGSTNRPVSGKPAGTYGYKVRACASANVTDCSDYSGTLSVAVQPPPGIPATPASITSSPTTSYNGNYGVSWQSSSGTSYYELEETINAGSPNVTNVGLDLMRSWTARPSGRYAYRVRACNSINQCSAYTGSTATDVYRTPGIPTLTASPTLSTDGAFTLTWTAVTDGASYKLEERVNNTGNWMPVQGGSGQSIRLERSENGQYYYKVRACNNAPSPGPICSDYSTVVVVEVRKPGVPTAPAWINAGQTNPRQCSQFPASYAVSWGPSDGAAYYELGETELNSVLDELHRVTVASKQFLKERGVYNEQYFNYVVRACSAGGQCSSWTGPAGHCVDTGIDVRAATTNVYVHTDALGSPVAETSDTGAELSRKAYTPWGAPATGSYVQGPGYTGHVTDALTGLSYMQQRYYDPVAGRFLSADPVAASPASFNRYWYANNNPYKFTDPDGRDVVFSVDPAAASGNGHTTLYFQDKGGDWHAYNQGAAGDAKSSGNLGFASGQDAKAGVSIESVSKDSVPNDGFRIQTSTKQDGLIAESAVKSADAHNSGDVKYNLYSNNCTDAAVGVVNNSGAGIQVANPSTTVKPNSWIQEIKNDPDNSVKRDGVKK